MTSFFPRLGPALLGAACLAATALAAPVALAQVCGSSTTPCCLLPPVAVPGLYGAPIWYGSGADKRVELDDPRWGGAPLTPFASGGGSEAVYRAVIVGDELSVSFQALVDPDGTGTAGAGDAVYIGISTNSSGSTARMLRIVPRDAGGTDPVFWNSGLDFNRYSYASGTWTADSDTTVPSYLISSSVYTWRNSPVGAVWAVNLKIDLSALIAPTSSFKMAFGMDQHTPTVPAEFTTPNVTGPRALSTPIVADATQWPEYLPRGTACTTGVSISNYAIGSTSASGENFVENGPNTFFADIQNIPAPVTSGKVRARFSIADWGSIAEPNAGWTEFSVSTNGDGYVPDGSAPGATWTNGPGTGEARITYSCTPSGSATYCPVITAPNSTATPSSDQCLLVELKPTPGSAGAGIMFQNAAARRNMLFEALSTVDRSATISARGLEAITGVKKDRDIYLYVQTKNMPAHGNQPLWLDTKQMALAKRYAQSPPVLPRPNNGDPEGKADGQKVDAKASVAVAPKGNAAELREAALIAQRTGSVFVENVRDVPVLSPEQAIGEAWPTYIVHVFYDTGKKRLVEGVESSVLRPMTPFGMHFTHDGALYGFTHALRGLGNVELQEIAPDFYKVVIKNEGSARVGVTVTAHEKPLSEQPGGSSGGCKCCQPTKVIVNNRGCYCTLPGVAQSGTVLPFGAAGVPLSLLPLLVFVYRRRRRNV